MKQARHLVEFPVILRKSLLHLAQVLEQSRIQVSGMNLMDTYSAQLYRWLKSSWCWVVEKCRVPLIHMAVEYRRLGWFQGS